MSKHAIRRANPVIRNLRIDMREMARPAVWGCAAAAALLAVAVASQTAVGKSRITTAYGLITGAPTEQERRTTQRQRDIENETRRLADAMTGLSDDRDQLLARIAVIERNYEDVTGSLGRLTYATAPSTEQQLFPLAASTDLAPVVAPPQPLPPATIAVAPVESSQAETAETTTARTDFGVDLGGGTSLASLRTAWDQIRRNHAGALEGLRPVIGVRDGKGGQVDLRLVVGPIPNAAAAAKLCAVLAAGGLSCQPAMFDGQRLALR